MGFELHKKGLLSYLTIPAFENTGLTKHGFSTRLGGFSEGPFESLNLGFKRDDDRETVIKNYEVLLKELDIDMEDLVRTDQVHGDKIHTASYQDRGKGFTRESDIHNIDALITQEKGVALVTYYADCVPLFFLDTKTPAVGFAHSGWRGTVKKIGQKTLFEMKRQFGSSLENMLIGIGPCIHKCCYEIGKTVVEEFKQSFTCWEDLLEYRGNQKWMLDLVTANIKAMEEIGIKPSQISVSDYCTSCFNDIFFSYRKDQGKTGSLAAMIQLI